jgi:hypothetical protein
VVANQVFGWVAILAGLLVGLVLGLRFHVEDWLGGYGSLRRRLVRLAHISLVALGFLNVLFASSASRLHLSPALFGTAAWALVVGGAGMPACCGLAAWRPGLRNLFAIPVASLLLGVGLAVWGSVSP